MLIRAIKIRNISWLRENNRSNYYTIFLRCLCFHNYNDNHLSSGSKIVIIMFQKVVSFVHLKNDKVRYFMDLVSRDFQNCIYFIWKVFSLQLNRKHIKLNVFLKARFVAVDRWWFEISRVLQENFKFPGNVQKNSKIFKFISSLQFSSQFPRKISQITTKDKPEKSSPLPPQIPTKLNIPSIVFQRN